MSSAKILEDVEQYIGFQVEETESTPGPFEAQILLNINSELSKLVQLGVIKPENFTGEATANTTWSDVLENESRLSMAKTYVKIGAKLVFDPPTASALLDALKNEKEECGWRAMTAVEEIAAEATP